ncbi:MAG: hypothetical protein ACRDT2_07875, partial [Natronosporangium sp.]
AAAAEHEAELFAAQVAGHRTELVEAQRRLTELVARRQEERQEVEDAQQRLTELTDRLANERQRLTQALAARPSGDEPADAPIEPSRAHTD